MPSPENFKILFFSIDVRILIGPGEKVEVEPPGVVDKVRATESTMEKYAEVDVTQLSQITMKADMATETEKMAKLLDISRMSKSRNNKVQVALGLPKCPRKSSFNLGYRRWTRPNQPWAMDLAQRTAIKCTRPQGLLLAAVIPLQVAESVRYVTRIGQPIVDKGLLLVKNPTVQVLLGTAFIDVSVDCILQRRQLEYPIESIAITITGTKGNDVRVNQLSDAEERPECCSVTKATKLRPMSQILVMMRASKSVLRMVEIYPQLGKRKPAMVA